MRLIVALSGALGLLLLYSGLLQRDAPPRRTFITRLNRSTSEAGLSEMGPGLLVISATFGILSGTFVTAFTGSLVIGCLFFGLAASVPFAYVRARRAKRTGRLREEWPDAIATLVAAIRAGVSLPEACGSLTKRSGDGLRPSFEAFSATYRATGSFAAGIHGMREVAADPVADRVAVVLVMAHEVGGTDLIPVLRTLGDLVRNDLRVRKEVEARWSWTITAARVAAAAPWIVLLLMSSRPEAAQAYNSGAGVATITLGAAATFAGYRLMLRVGRLPVQRRLP